MFVLLYILEKAVQLLVVLTFVWKGEKEAEQSRLSPMCSTLDGEVGP